MKNKTNETSRKEGILQALFVVILLLYPLRHITWGLDLWDTGYNYANFQYMGTEHMDSMWLFSTYLANAAGHFLTKLPMADTLVGMNFYTGLFAGILGIAGYFFCTKKLGIPSWIAFLGELAALSLCWCPTALLYNYLTYVLFLGCVILLYTGLSQGKMWHLAAAGVCLGANVFVRFSNLPEAAMIVAVWAYAVIEGREEKKTHKSNKNRGSFPRAVRYTLWCLLGYLGALFLIGGYIHLSYGIDAYIEGIVRLFSMTDNAPDYKATSMIMGLVGTYVENLYWAVRIGIIGAGGLVFFAVVWLVTERCRWVKARESLAKCLWTGSYAVWGLVSLAMTVWLYLRGFCTLEYYSYASILRPGILFLMLTMLIALVRIFHKNSVKEERLIGGMVLFVVLLTSIGSNNGVYPSINNLFVAAPYTLWQSFLFVKKVREHMIGRSFFQGVTLCAFPLKGLLIAFLAMFLFQAGIFGAGFVFAESTGVQDISVGVKNNEVLKGVKMSPEKAAWMTELSAYATEKEWRDREVILYGNLPSLSFYLQMPSAFNPWSDLDSYSLATMENALAQMKTELAQGAQKPVIIVENQYVLFEEEGIEALEHMGVAKNRLEKIAKDKKWEALKEFREKEGYVRTFSNEKFTVWE